MKLLFDHNLSPRLVQRLADMFPDSTHVAIVGLERATDWEVWSYARDQEYVIVTKDADFNDLSVLYGAPPKIVWLRIGNTTTTQIEQVLRLHYTRIITFDEDTTASLLTIVR